MKLNLLVRGREDYLADRYSDRVGGGFTSAVLSHTWTPPRLPSFQFVTTQTGLRLQPYIRTLNEALPLSLMEFADRALITTTRSKRL
jgi:hypothetical protein